MSSLVADVLHSTGKMEKENLTSKVNNLKKKVEDKKVEVFEIMKKIYVDYVPAYSQLEGTESTICELEKEYCDLHNHIEKEIQPQMVNYVTVFKDVVEDLKRVKKLKSAVQSLVSLHECLEKAKMNLNDNLFLKAAYQLAQFANTVKKMNLEDEKDIKVLNTIKIEYMETKEDLIYRTTNLWREKICIYSTSEGKKKNLSIKFSDISEESGKELLFALSLMNQLKTVLKEFGKQFLNIICSSVLLKTVTIRTTSDSSSFNLTVLNNSPEPSKAFKTLLDAFYFINENFFHLPADPNPESSVTALRELGMVIEEEFCTFVIDKRLKTVIPKQSKQLEAFRKEMSEAEDFCIKLQGLQFLPVSNKLLTFIHDVDDLPINKMAQNLLSQARTLMKGGLHPTITAGSGIEPVHEKENESGLDEMTKTQQQGLHEFSFSFPKCEISEWVKKLGDLFVVAKQEAKNIASPHAIRLYYTCRNICELYMCVAPTYHKEEIENIPQQAAIFHNNCMLLAHWVSILGPQFDEELSEVLNVPIPLTFVDLTPGIQKIGVEAFLAQMRKQKAQLIQLLQDQVAYASSMMDDGSVSKAEKAIRQCLCQLQFLKKVWSEVLPTETYFKAIGTLFNTCLEEVILRISSMEDIAADVAASLDTTFTIFIKHGPELFKVGSIDKRDLVHKYVRKWFKFQEFEIVLSASMREIVDRWASGKGPLADHFTSEEVKHLIRALFQNTERRAAALAKIR